MTVIFAVVRLEYPRPRQEYVHLTSAQRHNNPQTSARFYSLVAVPRYISPTRRVRLLLRPHRVLRCVRFCCDACFCSLRSLMSSCGHSYRYLLITILGKMVGLVPTTACLLNVAVHAVDIGLCIYIYIENNVSFV